jgi:hypothetical protein
MYEKKLGIDERIHEALRFYGLAAAQGDERGVQGVNRLAKNVMLYKLREERGDL